MKRVRLLFAGILACVTLGVAVPAVASAAALPVAPIFAQAATCDPSSGNFLAFPAWHEYLGGVQTDQGCVPELSRLADIWLIALAIIEIMLRIAALAAIGLVLWGGIQFITSQGDPSGTKAARQTVMNALIGLVIAVSATAVVTFLAGRFS